MTICLWIAVLALADIALILFVRGADARRNDAPERRPEWKTQ